MVKQGRANGQPVEFSLPEESRNTVEYFSASVAFMVVLAVIGPITDVVLFVIGQAIDRARRSVGEEPTLSVKIASLNTDSTLLEGFEAEGPASAVLAAIAELTK